MRVPYRPNSALYDDYFNGQVGHGMPVYIGRGGLGNVLSGLFRSVVPLMKRGGRALLKEGVKTAVQVGSDVLDGKSLSTSMKSRSRATGKRLLRGVLDEYEENGSRPRNTSRGPPGKRARKSPIKGGRTAPPSQRAPDVFD